MSESYEPRLVHLPGTKLTPQVTLKRTLEDVREDKYKRRVGAYASCRSAEHGDGRRSYMERRLSSRSCLVGAKNQLIKSA
jgi:hypothetical protein